MLTYQEPQMKYCRNMKVESFVFSAVCMGGAVKVWGFDGPQKDERRRGRVNPDRGFKAFPARSSASGNSHPSLPSLHPAPRGEKESPSELLPGSACRHVERHVRGAFHF